MTPSATAYITIAVDEFTYTALNQSTPIHSAVASTGASNPAITTGTVTASVGELIVAVLNVDDIATTSSVDGVFTLGSVQSTTSTREGIATAYDLSAAGNQAATFTLTANVPTASLIVSFMAGSLAPPFNGRIGEVAIWNIGDQATAERARKYLLRKWNIT